MSKYISYGQYLKSLRTSRGISLTVLSEKIGMSSQYLSEMERGGRKCLSDEKAAALAEVLALSGSEMEMLKSLSDRTKSRVAIPADVKAYIEENPYIIDAVKKAMDDGLLVTVTDSLKRSA